RCKVFCKAPTSLVGPPRRSQTPHVGTNRGAGFDTAVGEVKITMWNSVFHYASRDVSETGHTVDRSGRAAARARRREPRADERRLACRDDGSPQEHDLAAGARARAPGARAARRRARQSEP